MFEQLHLASVSGDREVLPVLWSEAKIHQLRQTADRVLQPRHPIDVAIAGALLSCAEGDISGGEASVISLLREYDPSCVEDASVFQRLIQAMFVVQRLDLVATLLRIRYNFDEDLEITIAHAGNNAACVLWDVLPSGGYRFTFDASVYGDDSTPHRIDQLQREFPLFAHYAHYSKREHGRVLVNQYDRGIAPGIAYCDSRPDYFLIPDCIFVPTRGYEYVRQVFSDARRPWQNRRAVAFWRGSTTGPKVGPNDWKSLDRIKLCELALRNAWTGRIDCGISSVVQMADTGSVANEIRKASLIKEFVPWQEWNHYKYLIDIDGNSCTWSNLFQRLLTGSTVLKVDSNRSLVQWYYDDLIPWNNYIPVAPDLSDLMEKIDWLERHDGFAEEVGRRGAELAHSLSYERELDRAMPVLSAAFQYFRGESKQIAPFGWVAD